MREIRTLGAMWRGLETDSRFGYRGTPRGNGSNGYRRGFAQMRQGVRVRAEARVEAEGGNRGSCCAPVWLRWRARQDLGSGEPFDDTHGESIERAGGCAEMPLG